MRPLGMMARYEPARPTDKRFYFGLPLRLVMSWSMYPIIITIIKTIIFMVIKTQFLSNYYTPREPPIGGRMGVGAQPPGAGRGIFALPRQATPRTPSKATPKNATRESAPSNECRDGRREGAGKERERGRGSGAKAPGGGEDRGKRPSRPSTHESPERSGGGLDNGLLRLRSAAAQFRSPFMIITVMI